MTIALAANGLTLVTLGEVEPLEISRFIPFARFRESFHLAGPVVTTCDRNVTSARIDASIAAANNPVLMVAQGSTCVTAAWWARLSPAQYVERVAGALLFIPSTRPGELDNFGSPKASLPFPSIVIGDDDVSQQLAHEWGSRLIDGPLPNPQREISSRFQSAILRFTRAIVEKDVRAAERLLAIIGDR